MTASPLIRFTLLAAATVLTTTGCSPAGTAASSIQTSSSSSTVGQAASGTSALPGEAAHVHGAALTGRRGLVLVATHGGLYEVTAAGAEQVGPLIDLMGFSATPSGELLASGHPAGDAARLPEPAGLLSSNDGGRTWRVRSRGGQSDFHALTAMGSGVVGFDGTLRTSKDRRSWRPGAIDTAPYALAATPTGDTVLATTERGVRRSTDGGASFTAVPRAPLLLLVAHDGRERFLGVTPSGELWTSEDRGSTWIARATASKGMPQALTARGDRVALVAGATVLVSDDGGATLTVLTA